MNQLTLENPIFMLWLIKHVIVVYFGTCSVYICYFFVLVFLTHFYVLHFDSLLCDENVLYEDVHENCLCRF